MSFNPTNLARAHEIVAQYPHAKSAILPLAHLAQDQDGWLSPEAMREIGHLVGVTPAEVLGTCSFYTMFKRTPCGKYLVSVCTNVTCLVTGGPEILNISRTATRTTPKSPSRRSNALPRAATRRRYRSTTSSTSTSIPISPPPSWTTTRPVH